MRRLISKRPRSRIKRAIVFILSLVLILQTFFPCGTEFMVSAMDFVEDDNPSYTIYFDATQIAMEKSFVEGGVYLYAYEDFFYPDRKTFSKNPVQMTPSELGENFFECKLDEMYTNVQFFLGSSMDAEIQSPVLTVDWTQYSAPCYTMSLVPDTVSASDSLTDTVSTNDQPVDTEMTYSVQMELTDLGELSGAYGMEDLVAGTFDLTKAVTLEAGRLYLNPAGMNLGDKDWSTESEVYISLPAWKEDALNSKGTRDSATGYWWWDISSWNSTDDYFFFAISSNWDTIKSGDYYRTALSSIKLSEVKAKVADKGVVFVQDGTASGTIDNKKVYAINEFTSLEGQTIYFVDATETLTAVKAVFSETSGFDTTEEVTVESTESASAVLSFTIPGEQKYVKFVDENDNQLGDIYNLYGETENGVQSILFTAGTSDTYYYNVTEKTDSTISTWGVTPETDETPLAGKTIYFDKLHFHAEQESYLQIGEGESIKLGATSDDENTLSYTFPVDSGATSQTWLTFMAADGTKYRFRCSDFGTDADPVNEVTLNYNVAYVTGEYEKAVTVYFDATFSKLFYGTEGGSTGIPANGGTGMIRYYATKSDDSSAFAEGDMELVAAYSVDGHAWKDVYKADLPEGYDKIVFSNFDMTNATNYGGYGNSTTTLTIPATLKNPCFYADVGDASAYTAYPDGTRDGYWAEVYSIRDAEKGKSTAQAEIDVVDIDDDQIFTRASNVLYINSTFYDYYTDYELNGNNRDTYKYDNGMSHRNWVTFRQFNQALSDYYKENSVSIPIYTGHFQPSAYADSDTFELIQPDLQLYGYYENYNLFMAVNNSNYDVNGNDKKVDYAAQGLVSSTLVQDALKVATGTGSVISEPHFDEAFLAGENSKNAVLGDVYHNVAFPFKQVDDDNDGISYWHFNSKDTTLAMKQDPNTNAYYLQDVGNQNWSKNVDSASEVAEVSTTYGFFPFNETSTATHANTYNYGFGAKLEFQFRLTENGKVLNNKGDEIPITFEFSGDDDVWVIIDDQLVLDVGGAHGIVHGEINFADKMATVEKAKVIDASHPEAEPAKSTFTLSGNTSTEHTLTMYYMERGMWESNMEIKFNFPDENQLEVEKQVDKTDVNDMFRNLFDNVSLFEYNIMNLATHYGEYKVTNSAQAATKQTFNDTFNDSTGDDEVNPTEAANTFAQVTDFGGHTNVVHWYAKYTDTGGMYRDERYGLIQPMNGTPVDISGMSYLEFSFYYDYYDTPSLSNMYLQLVDTGGKIKGNTTDYLSGKTYGIVTMANKQWVTVKINLGALAAEEGFNSQVQEIRFGYNYPRDIYLDDFIFCPAAVAGELTGFVTKQYHIPDYGSATSGKLEIPVGATYSSSTGENRVIGEDGTFYLQNGESIVFKDQFRRGSYIYLEEKTNALFETTWTMYENGQAVNYSPNAFGSGSTVANGVVNSLQSVSGTVVNDDRTEAVIDTTITDNGTDIVSKNAYTEAKQPSEKETFVFRSYANPDDVTTTTKLKVVYTNKVKVGSLKITKETLYPDETLSGSYQVKVVFSNIGGIALEDAPIETTVTLMAGGTATIEGIPLGHFYTVEEITTTDGSYLGEVRISHPSRMMIEPGTYIAKGVIDEQTGDDTIPIVTFRNTMEPKISASVIKKWTDELTGTELQSNLPASIRVQLQRKQENAEDSTYEVVTDYEAITIEPARENGAVVWKYTAGGLDKVVDYPNADGDPTNDNIKWVYRFVEIDSSGDVLENGQVLTLQSGTAEEDYEVTYGNPTADGDTGDYSGTITNTLLGPSNLKITKSSSETDERLPGVKFQLKKWDEEQNSYVAITNGEQSTSDYTDGDKVTGGEAVFSDLENGTYQLTELETADGYTLLKEPIIIVIDRKNCTFTYRMESEEASAAQNLTFDKDTRTIALSIKNAPGFVLPATGWTSPISFRTGVILYLSCICTAIGLIYRGKVSKRRTSN